MFARVHSLIESAMSIVPTASQLLTIIPESRPLSLRRLELGLQFLKRCLCRTEFGRSNLCI